MEKHDVFRPNSSNANSFKFEPLSLVAPKSWFCHKLISFQHDRISIGSCMPIWSFFMIYWRLRWCSLSLLVLLVVICWECEVLCFNLKRLNQKEEIDWKIWRCFIKWQYSGIILITTMSAFHLIPSLTPGGSNESIYYMKKTNNCTSTSLYALVNIDHTYLFHQSLNINFTHICGILLLCNAVFTFGPL